MSNFDAKTLGEDLEKVLAHDLHGSLANLKREVKRATRMIRIDAQNAVSNTSKAAWDAAHAMSDQARAGSAELTHFASRKVRAHPVATIAALLAATATLVGLMIAARRSDAATSASPPTSSLVG